MYDVWQSDDDIDYTDHDNTDDDNDANDNDDDDNTDNFEEECCIQEE